MVFDIFTLPLSCKMFSVDAKSLTYSHLGKNRCGNRDRLGSEGDLYIEISKKNGSSKKVFEKPPICY